MDVSSYLNSDEVTFHLHNNDYLGEADKLMTGSSGLFLYGSSKNIKHGVELSLQRRIPSKGNVFKIVEYITDLLRGSGFEGWEQSC